MDQAVQSYIDDIDPAHQPLFDRIQRLILEVHPDAVVSLSYKMPTFSVGKRRLHVGMWKHGVSIYGHGQGRETPLVPKHPKLKTSKGTIQLRLEEAAEIGDPERRDFLTSALEP